MKTLNENWFAFTLIAVVFGILGFLVGRTTGHRGMPGHPPHAGMHGKMPHCESGEMGSCNHHGATWITEDAVGELGELENIDVEVVKSEDGKVTVTIDSLETGEGKRKIRIMKKVIEE